MASNWNPKVLAARFMALLAESGDAPPAPEAESATAKLLGSDPGREQVERKVREILANKAEGSAGRVQILNLSSLKDRYAARWPLLSNKIDQLVGMTLRRRLSKGDTFAGCGEGIYVIVFDGIPESEAKVRCALIAEELLGKLAGQEAGISAIGVASAATQIDGRLDIEPFTKIEAMEELLRSIDQYTAGGTEKGDQSLAPSLGAVRDLMEDASRSIAEWETIPTERRAEAVVSDAERISDLLHHAEAVLLQRSAENTKSTLAAMVAPASASASASSTLEPLYGQVDAMRAAVARLIERAEAEMRSRRKEAALSLETLENAQVIVRYRPLWFVPSSVITGYDCNTGLEVEGRELFGAEILPEDAEPQLVAMIDRLTLGRAIRDIEVLIAQQGRTVVSVPIHHSTLMRMSFRQSLLNICRLINPQIRGYLAWEIINPVIGFTNSYLPAAVSFLQSFGRSVSVRVSLDHPRFDEFVGIGIYAVGADLAASSTPETQLINKLNLFRSRSERHGLKGFVHGVMTKSAAMAAVYAGFDILSGPAIGNFQHAPEPVSAFGVDAMYENQPSVE